MSLKHERKNKHDKAEYGRYNLKLLCTTHERQCNVHTVNTKVLSKSLYHVTGFGPLLEGVRTGRMSRTQSVVQNLSHNKQWPTPAFSAPDDKVFFNKEVTWASTLFRGSGVYSTNNFCVHPWLLPSISVRMLWGQRPCSMRSSWLLFPKEFHVVGDITYSENFANLEEIKCLYKRKESYFLIFSEFYFLFRNTICKYKNKSWN